MLLDVKISKSWNVICQDGLFFKSNVHDRPLYTVYPDMHSTVGGTP
jgi:hypothetical protein